MMNTRKISLIALMLLLIGITGSIFTFNKAYRAEEVLAQKTIADENIENIDIHTRNGRIEVLPTNEAEITAELLTKGSKYELLTKVEDDTLFIQAINQQGSFVNLNFFSIGAVLTVYIPREIYESVQVEGNNGRINLEGIQAKDIDVKTDNGRIELKDIHSSSINVRSSNGKVIFDHVAGNISGKTNNGSIKLVTADLDRSINFETDNGKIEILTDHEPADATLDLRVGNGKINYFGKNDWNAVIGSGTNVIKLKTSNGSITLTK